MGARQRRGSGSDEILKVCLAKGMTIRDAAALAGMSERTARRRLQDPEFVESLRVLEGELASSIASQLTALSCDAVQTLRELLAFESLPGLRFRAAQAVLLLGHKYRATEDQQRRLATLEATAIERGAVLDEVRSRQQRGQSDAS